MLKTIKTCDLCDHEIIADAQVFEVQENKKKKFNYSLSLTGRRNRQYISQGCQLNISSDLYIMNSAGRPGSHDFHFHKDCLRDAINKRLREWHMDMDDDS